MNNAAKPIKEFLNRQFPRSFLIQKPLLGAFVFFIILYLFVVIYHPLGVRGTRSFSFSFTMLIYCFIISTMVLAAAIMIKRTNCFSNNKVWTISKELLSIVVILTCNGLITYFAGFIIENPSSRWNLPTFLDSFSRAILIGIIPVLFPSLLNIRYVFTPEIFQEYKSIEQNREAELTEVLIHIRSRAKKEELSFYPGEFIYVESEGNYVIFHLKKQGKTSKVIIRNSISDIENQLTEIPFFMRIHRAFIVNLKNVNSKSGNSLGYRLKLKGSDNIIPVSRQNTQKFDELTRQFLLSVHH